MKIPNLIIIAIAVIFMISFGLFLYRIEKHSDPPAVNAKYKKEKINQ